MNDLRTAAQQALEAMDKATGWMSDADYRKLNEAIEALRAALAQQAEPVEPVAWSGYDLDGMVEAFSRVIEAHHANSHPFHNPIDMDARTALRILRGLVPAMKAYTAPPQQTEPVRLQCVTCGTVYADGVPPQVPVQAKPVEPVAWIPIEQIYPQAKAIDILMGDGSILRAVLPQFDGDLWWEGSGTGEKFIDPKYANVTHWRIHGEHTAPPQRKPLTDEEVLNIIDDVLEGGSLVDVARAVEAAHGIKEEK